MTGLAEELEALDDVRLERGAPLARSTTLRIGGPAEILLEVATEEALVAALERIEARGAPLHLLGLGSNVLIPDRGLEGVVVRLVGDFKDYRLDPENRDDQSVAVESGAAMPLALLANRLTKDGLLGLEALSGFQSSVGGAVYMNAGCYGTEIKDLLISTRVARPGGAIEELAVEDLAPEYRRTALHGTGAIVLDARFRLERGDGERALARIKELNKKRWAALPSGKPTAGSVFRNPEGDYAGRLIQECGLKGQVVGGAAISEKHANVIVNLGDARADDVMGLMERAYCAVQDRFSIELEPEVVLAGELGRRWWSEVVGGSASGAVGG